MNLSDAKPMLTQERLKELLDYNSITGIFTWKVKRGSVKVGQIAGCLDEYGYLLAQLDGKMYKLHRLAWLYVTGKFPSGNIDHKNCNKSDNRIENLREAENNGNQKFNTQAHKNNLLGIKGIRRVAYGYQARITGKNGLYTIGVYASLEKAKAAYAAEALKVHGQFIHASVKENLNECK